MRFLRYAYLLVLLLAAAGPALCQAAEQARMNVLLIISDDLNVNIGCYGHAKVLTPHLDRLAREGVRFDRAYCNYPVCSPSRTSLLSGRYCLTTEVVGNGVDPRVVLGPDFRFLPEYFKDHGYYTAGIGKVTHTPEFLHSIQWDRAEDTQHDPAYGFEEKKARLKTAPDEEHPDGITARTVARLMEEQRDRPFFIGAGFHRPHAPRIAPQKYYDLYPLEEIRLPTGRTETDIPQIALPPHYEPAMSEQEQRLYLQSYYASVTFMDAQVGVLLETMDRLDLWKNTVVVFLGDNGYHLGEHGGFWGKMSLMEESGRVPLILYAPGMTDRPCPRAVGLVDLFPSLTELCELPAPEGLEGNSLVPWLKNPSAPRTQPALSMVVRGEKKGGQLELGRSVHTDRYTFIEWPDKSLQLYDDQKDPRQTRNLAHDPAKADLVTELQKSLLPRDRLPAHKGIMQAAAGSAKSPKKRSAAPDQKGEKDGLLTDGRRAPNVVVILADDLGYHDLGVHGSPDIPTPHIDSLAQNGIRCTNAYVSASVCSPSRAGLLTGRYQNRFGFEFLADPNALPSGDAKIGLAVEEKTMADRMKNLGYVTGCIGKWHLGSDPEFLPTQRGFDEFYGSSGQSNYFEPTLIDSRQSPKPTKIKRPGYYLTDDYAEQSVDFIQRHRQQPFFLYLPHFAVHKPYEATETYLARVAGIADEKRRAHAAMTSALDDAVGRVLATLKDQGLLEDTLIFFLSDNGGTGGVGDNQPLRGGKGSTWEGGFRTPFLIQWKGHLPAGKVYEHPIISLDILPTALAAAGSKADARWKLDGVNLLPFLKGENAEPPHDMLYWRFGTQWAIRRGPWKLVQSREARGGNIQIAKEGPVRLFNLTKDIGEKDDLSAQLPERVARLRERWEAWNQKLPPPSWLPNLEKADTE